ncbi:hypothetical protein QBC46DRAFT_391115 [Diplogelasinospora grovesii]|uniref:Uncharacterized protein n=1 Tax=Diplogelasinospora grovesii TaxID=303347 RepID=A0AAN6S2I2_9PEZI|nr:hypothetical protein QBC46DRAFT_391115 [Diplogelasinospora grovesii]
METSDSPTLDSIGIKNRNLNVPSGLHLSEHQQVLVGSVLDLFEGCPSLKHLGLWQKEGTFTDNITIAQGYDKYAAQWYGLPAMFDPIELQKHKILSNGNPIELEITNKYTVKGMGEGQTMDSLVRIFVGDDGKIAKVEDKWNPSLPEGSISEAFRKLNAVMVLTMIKVPETEQEDMEMKAQRMKDRNE